MLGDCVVVGEEGRSCKMSDKSPDALKNSLSSTLSSPPPAKKLKQARLSFKVLEKQPVIEAKPVSTPGSGKKRKHSESGVGQKAAKIQKNDTENEVSSSSEADFVAKVSPSVESKAIKPRGLDRFVQSTQQLEVSTSCEEVVDLTADDEISTAPAKPESTPAKNASPREIQKSEDKENKQEAVKDDAVVENETPAEKSHPSKTENKNDNDSKDAQQDLPETANTEETAEKPDTETTKTEADEGLDEDNDESDSKPGDCDNSTLDSTMDTSDLVSQSLDDTTEVSDDEKDSDDDSTTKDTSVSSSGPSTPTTRTLKRPPLSSAKSKMKDEEREKRKLEKEKAREERQRQKELEKQKKKDMRKEKEKQKEEQRLEKEKQKKEEKERKEQEKLQREKERQEKLAEKEKEKEEKLRQKEEEKKKKQEALEAKLEEKKRKEEEKDAEKKRKEEEKLNAEAQKNRKIHQSQSLFKKFFVKVEPSEPIKATENVGPFPAFHVLPNMRMAPRARASLPGQRRQELDDHLQNQSAAELYTELLRSGQSCPGVSARTWPAEDDDDLITLGDSPDQPLPAGKMKAKLLKFHENYRPAYFGTWRKRSKTISPRNPFKKDEVYLDYEVDSDDEWEEEEPGESLSNSEGEGEEVEEDNGDDDEDDGFFVPHGYLSDGEGGEDDGEEEHGCNPEKMKIRQMIKAKAFEAELKKRTEVLRMLIIGCHWCQPSGDTDPCLSQYSANFISDESPIMIREGPEITTKQSKSSKKGGSEHTPKAAKDPRALEVPNEAMAHLIRLVHGNIASLKKLIREFRVFWAKQKSGNVGDTTMDVGEDSPEKKKRCTEDKPLQETQKEASVARTEAGTKDADPEKGDTGGTSMISKRQLDIKIRSIANYGKQGSYHRKCWYVNADVLEKYALTELPVPTEWQWITPGPAKPKEVENPTTPSVKKPSKELPTHSTPNNHSIKQFAVPGLIHANTPEVLEATKPKAATTSTNVQSVNNSAKKQVKRITPITLFCGKKPDPGSSLKPAASSNVKRRKAGSVGTKAAVLKPAPAPISEEGQDDDCMIIDEQFIPPPPSKSQPTLLSMFPVKNTA